MQLKSDLRFNLSIGSETEVLNFTYAQANPLEVIARVNLGDGVNDLSGAGGLYSMRFYLNNIQVLPDIPITVPAGKVQAVMVSRPVPIVTGDIISIRVLGLPSDTNVNTISTLRDATPILAADIIGGGPVQVDHNFGGPNALAYQTSGGLGIANATIQVYNAVDFNAGNTDPSFVIATSTTVANQGQWLRPVMLNPGNYVIRFFLPNQFGPDTVTISVPQFGSVPTNPLAVTTLQLWLDPTGPTLFQNTTLTLQATVAGQPVEGWTDKSGAANTAKGTAGGVLNTGVVNSLPVVVSNGSTNLLLTSIINLTGPYTVYFICSPLFASNNLRALNQNGGAGAGFFATPTGTWNVKDSAGHLDSAVAPTLQNTFAGRIRRDAAGNNYFAGTGQPEIRLGNTATGNIPIADLFANSLGSFTDAGVGLGDTLVYLKDTVASGDDLGLRLFIQEKWALSIP